MRAVEIFDRWARTQYLTGSSSLGLYRIAFALVILIKELPQGLWVSSFPDSFFNPPPGPTFFFFHGFPSPPFFYFLNGLLVFATVCLLFGYWTRTASVAFSVGFTFLQAWEYSFGKINHEFVIVPIPILFAWAGWGMAWSVDGRRKQNTASPTSATPIALFAFILSIMMLSAGAPKVVSGWLNPWTHAVLAKIVIAHFVMGSATWFSQEALKIRSGWFWEPLDWFSCTLEIAFICLFFRRFLMRLVCAFATLFHFGIAFLMKITSWGNVLSYGAFADWDEIVKFFPFSLIRSLGNLISRACRISVLTIAAVTTAVYLSFGNPVAKLVARTPQEADFRIGTFLVILAAITGVVFLVRRGLRIRTGESSEPIDELRPAGLLQKKL